MKSNKRELIINYKKTHRNSGAGFIKIFMISILLGRTLLSPIVFADKIDYVIFFLLF